MLTMRNWLIGYYIVEFEQKGKERVQSIRGDWKDFAKFGLIRDLIYEIARK